MPRWASRVALTITDVRVQRVQEISEEDAIAEGIERGIIECDDGVNQEVWFGAYYAGNFTPEGAYSNLWDSLHNPRGYCAEDEPRGWAANPWVSALTFTVDLRNIDDTGARVAA